MFTAAFFRAVAERVLSTAAQAFLALLIVSGFDLRTADWADIASVVGLASLICVAKCFAAAGISKTGPGFVDSEQVVPAVSEKGCDEQRSQAPYVARHAMPAEVHGGNSDFGRRDE